jgi:hypothetical protein
LLILNPLKAKNVFQEVTVMSKKHLFSCKVATLIVGLLFTGACAPLSSNLEEASTLVVPPPTITSPTSPYTSNTDTITIDGTCIDGYLVNIVGELVEGEVLSPPGSLYVACSAGFYQFVVQKPAQGTYMLYLRQWEPQGYVSEGVPLVWTYQ